MVKVNLSSSVISIGLPNSTSLTIAVLIASVLSFALGIAVATLIMYCYIHAHHKPPTSLTRKEAMYSANQTSEYQDIYQDVSTGPLKSTKPPVSLTSQEIQQATHSASQASKYQGVYQDVTKVSAHPLKWTELDIDVCLMQNSAYGQIHEVSTDELNENSDCVVFSPICS